MEDHESSALTTMVTERAEVDNSRPFLSVKEAVAVFGERFLVGDAYPQKTSSSCVKLDDATPRPINSLPAPKPIYSASSSPPSYTSSASQFNQERDEFMILSSLKKLEAEMEEIKRELMLLKERESETEMAVATLTTQLHESMSKLAEIEATRAEESSPSMEGRSSNVESHRWAGERTRELEARFEYLPTLSQALSLGDIEDGFGGGRGKRKVPKKKPIIPLIGDIFSRRKSSSDLNNSLYSRSFYGVLS